MAPKSRRVSCSATPRTRSWSPTSSPTWSLEGCVTTTDDGARMNLPINTELHTWGISASAITVSPSRCWTARKRARKGVVKVFGDRVFAGTTSRSTRARCAVLLRRLCRATPVSPPREVGRKLPQDLVGFCGRSARPGAPRGERATPARGEYCGGRGRESAIQNATQLANIRRI